MSLLNGTDKGVIAENIKSLMRKGKKQSHAITMAHRFSKRGGPKVSLKTKMASPALDVSTGPPDLADAPNPLQVG